MHEPVKQIHEYYCAQERLAGCLEAANEENSGLKSSLLREQETTSATLVMSASVITANAVTRKRRPTRERRGAFRDGYASQSADLLCKLIRPYYTQTCRSEANLTQQDGKHWLSLQTDVAAM